jgi:predicted nucleotidyltransferase
MVSLVAERREEIAALCARYEVERLEVFGSAVDGRFDGGDGGGGRGGSDVDFLVAFKRGSRVRPGEQYLGLLTGLEALLGRRVDLVDVRAASNPYFLVEALKRRERVYAG